MKSVAGSAMDAWWVLLALLVFTTPSQAQFYKWSDEAGNVHYSQNPPPGREAIPLDIKVKQPEASANAATSNGAETPIRCGSITVPPPRRDAVSSIAMYREAIGVWQKYITENQAKSDEATLQRIKDRRCAIDQANKALDGLSETAQSLDAMHQQVKDDIASLEEQLAECDNPEREEDGRSAAACKQHYQAQIKKLKQQQRKMVPLGTVLGESPGN